MAGAEPPLGRGVVELIDEGLAATSRERIGELQRRQAEGDVADHIHEKLAAPGVGPARKRIRNQCVGIVRRKLLNHPSQSIGVEHPERGFQPIKEIGLVARPADHHLDVTLGGSTGGGLDQRFAMQGERAVMGGHEGRAQIAARHVRDGHRRLALCRQDPVQRGVLERGGDHGRSHS